MFWWLFGVYCYAVRGFDQTLKNGGEPVPRGFFLYKLHYASLFFQSICPNLKMEGGEESISAASSS